MLNFKYEDDEDKAEEFKIISFISMVNGCDRLGIPYGGKHYSCRLFYFTCLHHLLLSLTS